MLCTDILLKVIPIKNPTLLSDLGGAGQNHRTIELSSKCIQKVSIYFVSQQKTGKAKISKFYGKFSPVFLKNLYQIKCFNKGGGLRKVFGKKDLVTHMGS